MSEQAARDAVIRMATDPEFREGVRSNDPAVFAGLELSQEEIAQLRSLSSDDSGAGVEQLAARLSKSSLGGFFSSSLASLHGGGSHDAAGSYTPEQHDTAASAPVPLTEHAAPAQHTGHDDASFSCGCQMPHAADEPHDAANGNAGWVGTPFPVSTLGEHDVTFHDPASGNAPPGGGNYDPAGSYTPEQHSDAGWIIPLEGHRNVTTNHPLAGGEAGIYKPSANDPTGGGFIPAGAGQTHSLLNHPTDGGPAAQGAPVHHGDASYEKPDKPDGGPKPPKLDALISDDDGQAAQKVVWVHDVGGGHDAPDYPTGGGFHTTDAGHSASHGDASYEKPDKPDGGPKPPKLDALISDHANLEGAHEQAGQSGYYGGETNPVGER